MTTTSSPTCSSRPRSRSMRTVSTAKSGMPSAASRRRARSASGSPGTSPVRSSSIASSSSGSSGSVVALRVAPGKPGCRSATSGRASVSTKIGWWRPQSSRYSTNATRPSSAQWRSSKTMTSGPCSARRSKKRLQAENRSSRSGAERSERPSRCMSRGSIHVRSSSSGTCSSKAARSFASAVSASSSSRIFARPRSISASAQ